MDHIVYEIKYNIHKTAKEDTKEQPNLGFPVSSLPWENDAMWFLASQPIANLKE